VVAARLPNWREPTPKELEAIRREMDEYFERLTGGRVA
jgi:hypothetical protein